MNLRLDSTYTLMKGVDTMQVRCQRCNYSFTLSRQAVTAALEEISKTSSKHYNVECPKCRRQIKIQSREILRLKPD